MPSLPASSTLAGARRWLELLRDSSLARARSTLTSSLAYRDLTPTQYETSLAWLKEKGLVSPEGRPMWAVARSETSIGHAVLEVAIESARPNWLQDADELVLGSLDLPDDLATAASALGLDRDTVTGCVRHVWGKVDVERRTAVGLAGELAFLVFLRALCEGPAVRHVAADSDGYGYDVDVAMNGHSAHLEVKSTTRRGRLIFYLSRNEYEVMFRDPHWSLPVVLLNAGRELQAVGVVDREWIRSAVPVDQSPRARWQSVRLEPGPEAVSPGLGSALPWLTERLSNDHPAVTGLVAGLAPAWLTARGPDEGPAGCG